MSPSILTSLLAQAVLLGVLLGAPQEKSKTPPKGGQDDGYQQDVGPYGETPEEFAPYGRTGRYYWRFFDAPLLFRGAGRDLPPPSDLESVKIGLIAPIESGPDLAVGQAMHRGVSLAMKEANAAGGYEGKLPYELVLRNDSGLWGASSNTMVELAYEQRVWAVIGSVDAANSHIALRVALKAEVPMINTASTDPTMTETAIPWILRTYPDDRQHGYRLAKFIYLEKEVGRVAILRSNDKFGRMGVAEFIDAARRLGHPIVLEVRYNPGERGLDKQLERIRRSNVEAVVLWSNAVDAGNILKEMRAAGMKHQVYGTDRLLSPAFLETAGDAADGVIATSPMAPDRKEKEWEKFRKAFVDAFDTEPDLFAAFSYDGARILLSSIEKAGLNRVRIRDELVKLTEYAGASGRMKFDLTLNNLGSMHVLQVQGGRFVRLAEK